MTRVLFLPDFGTEVGGGHVMRCLTLAGELTRRGARCGFSVLPEAEKVIRAFAGDTVEIVPRDWPAPIAVIDGYDYGEDHERALAAEGRRVAAIDDLRRRHHCDLVMDSEPGRSLLDYPGKAKVLGGLDYVLIRPEFIAARDAAIAGRSLDGRRVLVSLGLTDVGAITRQVLKLMQDMPCWEAADVVLGEGAESLPFVQDLAARDPRVTLHVNSRDMAGLAARANFAVGAGGGSLWERSVMGLAGVTVVLADNQVHAAHFLADHRAGLMADARESCFATDFVEALDTLAGNPVIRRAMGNRAAALVDGKGAQRCADAVLALAS